MKHDVCNELMGLHHHSGAYDDQINYVLNYGGMCLHPRNQKKLIEFGTVANLPSYCCSFLFVPVFFLFMSLSMFLSISVSFLTHLFCLPVVLLFFIFLSFLICLFFFHSSSSSVLHLSPHLHSLLSS